MSKRHYDFMAPLISGASSQFAESYLTSTRLKYQHVLD